MLTSQQITVLAPENVLPRHYEPHRACILSPRENLCALGVYDRGSVALGVQVEQGEIEPGGNVRIKIAIANYSDATIKAVEFGIFETITCITDRGGRVFSHDCFFKRCDANELRGVNLIPRKLRYPKEMGLLCQMSQ